MATTEATAAAAAVAAADSTTSTSTIYRVRGRINHRDYDDRLERDHERELNGGGGGCNTKSIEDAFDSMKHPKWR